MRAILFGIIAAFFFATTFILNRQMNLSGGSWIWSAALRYIFTLPLFFLLVWRKSGLEALLYDLKVRPLTWLSWSTIGFGIFYAPICFASTYGPAWLISGTWQITIVAGSLLIPFLNPSAARKDDIHQAHYKIPLSSIAISMVIILGIFLMQMNQAEHLEISQLLLGTLPVLVAAFAYPLGNRKMMALCKGRLDTYQRILGMTIASMPFWLLLSLYGLTTAGAPSRQQIIQSFTVALFSGVIATVLFFSATDMVKDNMRKLAAVEATQSLEIVFTLAGEMLLLSIALPDTLSMVGMSIVMIGMLAHSLTIIR